MTTSKINKLVLGGITFWFGFIVLLVFKIFFNPSPFAFNIATKSLVIIILVFVILDFPSWIGLYIIQIGGFFNFLVIAINGGMPVSREVPEVYVFFSEIHKHINDDTRLPFLADIFEFKIGYSYFFYSIGDVLITVGVLLFILQLIYTFIKFIKKYQTSKRKGIVFSESP